MTLRDVLAELGTQQKLAADQRDVLWRDYFASRWVVVVPDEPGYLKARGAVPWQPGMLNPEDAVRGNGPVFEVLKILRGALAQPNIGAARPMIKSAIERLEGRTT